MGLLGCSICLFASTYRKQPYMQILKMLHWASIEREAGREEVENGERRLKCRWDISLLTKEKRVWALTALMGITEAAPPESPPRYPLPVALRCHWSPGWGLAPGLSHAPGWPHNPAETWGSSVQRHIIPAAFSNNPATRAALVPQLSQTAHWNQVKVQDFLDDKMASVLPVTHRLSVPPQLSVLSVWEREKDGWWQEHCQSEEGIC